MLHCLWAQPGNSTIYNGKWFEPRGISYNMTTAQVVKMSATTNSLSKDYPGFDLNFLFHWPAGPVIYQHISGPQKISLAPANIQWITQAYFLNLVKVKWRKCFPCTLIFRGLAWLTSTKVFSLIMFTGQPGQPLRHFSGPLVFLLAWGQWTTIKIEPCYPHPDDHTKQITIYNIIVQ